MFKHSQTLCFVSHPLKILCWPADHYQWKSLWLRQLRHCLNENNQIFTFLNSAHIQQVLSGQVVFLFNSQNFINADASFKIRMTSLIDHIYFCGIHMDKMDQILSCLITDSDDSVSTL